MVSVIERCMMKVLPWFALLFAYTAVPADAHLTFAGTPKTDLFSSARLIDTNQSQSLEAVSTEISVCPPASSPASILLPAITDRLLTTRLRTTTLPTLPATTANVSALPLLPVPPVCLTVPVLIMTGFMTNAARPLILMRLQTVLLPAN